MPKKMRSNGNRRPIRYENWNEAKTIRYDGNIAIINHVLFNFVFTLFKQSVKVKELHQINMLPEDLSF